MKKLYEAIKVSDRLPNKEDNYFVLVRQTGFPDSPLKEDTRWFLNGRWELDSTWTVEEWLEPISKTGL